MADTKISDLPSAASVDGLELIPVAKAGSTQKITPAQIKTYMGVSGINTGDQDLSALALKSTTVNGQPLSANVTVTKSDVGLGNAENTSDINKPISTATAIALAGKQATLVSTTNIKTINGNSLLGAGDLVITGAGTVTSASVVTANGFTGSVATATTTPAITIATNVTGLLKGNGTAIAAAVAGTDIKTINSASLIGSGDIAVGTVTTASVATANGFAGSVATASTTPVITLTTNLTGLLKGNGTAMSVATPGVDYVVPSAIAASVKDYGAVGDGVTDDLAAFQAAAAARKVIYVPAGTYVVSGTTTISQDGSYWYGEGISASIISSSDDNTPIFSINTGLNGVSFSNMQLTRSVTAIAGGDGIKSSTVTIGQARLSNLLVQKQYNGLSLGPTDWSEVSKCIIQKNINVGVFITNTAGDGTCQWSFDSVLSQMNGAQGYFTQSIAGPAQMTVGTFKNCATFANTGVGMAFVGTAGVPLQGVRIDGGFIGEDGNSAIYLDTYGGQHMIDGAFLELSGTRTTGPTLATAASNLGSGIHVTSNNVSVLISACHSNGNSLDGFYLNGTSHSLGNCRATNNGVASTAGRRNGINSTAGRVVVNGGIYGNTGAGTSQLYGCFITDGNNLSVVGADLTGNATAATGATSSATYITKMGCLPNTLDVGLSPAGAVLIGGNATGDWNSAGTLNVSGGLLKNDTAYTNP